MLWLCTVFIAHVIVYYCYHVWWCTTLFCFYCIFLYPCMVINVSVQYNEGLLPTLSYKWPKLFPSGNSLICHEEVLFLQPLLPPKRIAISPPLTEGCSEGLGAFWFTFKYHVVALYSIYSPCSSILLLPCVMVYYIVFFFCNLVSLHGD